MFEFLMLMGFLGAGLCHWQPLKAKSESAEREEKSRGKRDKKAGVMEKRQGHKGVRARIAAA
jgi:hypothetical protein